MSILTWLKEVTTGETKAGFIDTESVTFAKGEEQFHGLDMKGALDAHAAWIRLLEDRLNGRNQVKLTIADASSDCQCPLGKWLHSEGLRQFGGSGEYQELRSMHADFHRKAGEILENVVKGNRPQALENLKELRYQSGNVQLSLVRLYSHTQH